MLYCTHCLLLTEERVCPECGSEDLRAPEDGDFCFLTERQALWAGLLADVLKQEGILFVKKSVQGAGLAAKIGPLAERIRFYVPYDRYSAAKELETAVFSAESLAEE